MVEQGSHTHRFSRRKLLASAAMLPLALRESAVSAPVMQRQGETAPLVDGDRLFHSFKESVVAELRQGKEYVGSFTNKELGPLLRSIGNSLISQKIKTSEFAQDHKIKAEIHDLTSEIQEGLLTLEGNATASMQQFGIPVPADVDFSATVHEDVQTMKIDTVDPVIKGDSLLIKTLQRTGNFDVKKYTDNPQEDVLHLLNKLFDGQVTIDDCWVSLHPDKGTVRLKGRANGDDNTTR